MLKPDQVQLVKELRATGRSQREISRETGIARETVRGIVNGKRPHYAKDQAESGVADNENALRLFEGKVDRCPTCGGRVYIPCLACQLRARLSN